MPDEYDVFLSHAPADEVAVQELAQRLRDDAKLQPFLRRWHLIPGENWVSGLEHAMEASATVAVFCGPGGRDAWRDEENQLALVNQVRRHDKRVIPVLLPGASERDIDGFLSLRTWVDLGEDDGFVRLVAGITGRAPEPGPSTAGGRPGRQGRRKAPPRPRPKPPRVFVSSALCDDPQRRSELVETIDSVGMVPYAEPWLAEPGTEAAELQARHRELEGCDLLLVLVAWRHGTLLEDHDRSIVELDHAWAVERKLPRLVFLVDEERPVVIARELDEGPQRWAMQARLQAFKARLEAAESIVRFTPDNLTARVALGLDEWHRERKRVQRVALKKEATRSPEVGADEPPKPPTKRRARKGRARPERPRELLRYLEAVERDHATTPMFGADVPRRVPLRPDDLRVEIRLAPRRAPNEPIARAPHDPPSPELEPLEPESPEPEHDLHEVFRLAEQDGYRGVLLVGSPGSGKSAHLRRLALWLSRRSATTLGLPVDTVPVVLPLPELPADAESFRHAVVAHLQRDPGLDAPQIQALLERDHLLFLVDGLDELPTQALRERAVAWLDQGLRDHPHARFLVTRRSSDPVGAEPWPAPLLEVRLPPLDEAHARALVERWFRAMEPRGDAARAEAERRTAALWAELRTPEFRTPRMFELARNPLMLTVLCMVHRQRGQLPARRVELFEQCVQVLVHRWCSTGDLPRRFGDREARQVLQPLAYWLHGERGRTHADTRAIAAALEPHLVAALDYEVIDPEAFVRAVSTGDGILIAKGGDGHGLLHLCFQEYLCARHLRSLAYGDLGVLDRLADRFGDPWWREVTVLLLALGEPALFEPLMQRVIERPGFVEHLDWVVECIRDAAEGSVEPFVELLERPPGQDPELWTRQRAAWRVVEKVRPERLPSVAPGLRHHPLEELRRLAGQDGSEPAPWFSARGGHALLEIPAGRFMMGSHPRERGRKGGEGPRHEVELARFFMGKYPVTNEEYGLYLRACPQVAEPAYWADPRYNQPRQPVVGVSWHEAMAYCEWAGLSLPTEAQWERACRGGTRTAYWSGREEEDLARIGWYADNSEQRLHCVGERDPNPLGLYDLHGNVWEWCLDEFGDYRECPPRPGDGLRHPPLESGNRVIRGGSWIDTARKARSASRLNRHADNRLSYLGFRAVKCVDVEAQDAEATTASTTMSLSTSSDDSPSDAVAPAGLPQ